MGPFSRKHPVVTQTCGEASAFLLVSQSEQEPSFLILQKDVWKSASCFIYLFLHGPNCLQFSNLLSLSICSRSARPAKSLRSASPASVAPARFNLPPGFKSLDACGWRGSQPSHFRDLGNLLSFELLPGGFLT